MKNKKEPSDYSFKISKIILFLLNGLVQKISLKLIENGKKQLERIIQKIKEGILVAFFLLTGIFFLFLGLIIYLDSVLDFVPGGGFFIIGGISVLIALMVILINFFKK